MVRVCRVTAGRRWVSKDRLKPIAEISKLRSWASYLYIDSVTCHNRLFPSTLAFSMHGRVNHERTKHLNVDQQYEISPEHRENWPKNLVAMIQQTIWRCYEASCRTAGKTRIYWSGQHGKPDRATSARPWIRSHRIRP